MLIGMFTDPHIGLRRLSGTTAESQVRLKFLLENMAHSAIETLRQKEAKEVICLGDLFDKFSNSEEDIAVGAKIVEKCDYVLAGNHDVSNQVSKSGSLKLLSQISESGDNVVISKDPSVPYMEILKNTDSFLVVAIPHCINAETFHSSIEHAIAGASSAGSKFKYLLLHCNVGEGFGETMSSHELWLTAEYAEKALRVFDRIFIGHEHEPSFKNVENGKFVPSDLDDAGIVILGNTYPLSFGEISDRSVYILNAARNTVESFCTVTSKEILTKVKVEDLVLGGVKVSTPYVRIEGTLKYEDTAKFYSNVSRIFKENPTLIMIGKYYEEEGKGLERIKGSGLKTIEEIVRESAETEGFLDILKEIENA